MPYLVHLLILVSFWCVQQGKTSVFWIPPSDQVVLSVGRPHSSIRMHLSLDTMNMVDDSCLSPSNFHEMVKAGGAAMGTRVHSIDVILGFNKDQDQDPLLNPGGNAVAHRVRGDSLGDPGKQDSHHYGHLPSLRDDSEQPAFHGESYMDETRVLLSHKWCLLLYISSAITP